MQVNQQCHLHALHGFLGKPDDWAAFPLGCQVSTYNLFQDFPVAPFSHWAAIFNQYVLASRSLQYRNPQQHIFMGYSLGGRLGLHAILQDPSLWNAAIFISTHPGLKKEKEKQQRLAYDRQWAQRFEREPWEDLIKDWNAQEMFKGEPFHLKREEKDFDRTSLIQALNTWSLGAQQNATEAIHNLDIPILWMVGARDPKFLQQAQELTFKHPQSRVCVVPEASHRLPWQQPEKFMSHLTQFIYNLEQ